MVFETLHPTLAITLISTGILVIINAFYRFLINQNKAKETKERVAELQKKSKEAKGDEAKQKEAMKEMMKEQNKLMKMNMKPMIFSFVVVILLLPLFSGLYDVNVATVDGPADFPLLGKEYTLTRTDSTISVTGADSFDCQLPCKQAISGNVWNIREEGNSIVKLEIVAATLPPGLPLVGGWELAWIWWYILVSIPFSLIVRPLYGIKS